MVQKVPASSGELVHDALRLDLLPVFVFLMKGALHSLQATSISLLLVLSIDLTLD
jgi:hypothetical protein